MTTVKEVLDRCTVEGFNVKMPVERIDVPLYQKVKRQIELIGGKWKGGKIQAFEFKEDPSVHFDKISAGQKVNIAKEFQWYETNPKRSDEVIELAKIEEGMNILEPSAGQGALIAAVYRAFPYYPTGPNHKPGVTVDYFELMDLNNKILSEKIQANERWSSSTCWMGDDFLKPNDVEWFYDRYDRVVANPPFSKNQDIMHFQQMYNFVKPGGRIVSFMSNNWREGSQKLQVSFQDFLKKRGRRIIEVPVGEFKNVSLPNCIVIVDKPR